MAARARNPIFRRVLNPAQRARGRTRWTVRLDAGPVRGRAKNQGVNSPRIGHLERNTGLARRMNILAVIFTNKPRER